MRGGQGTEQTHDTQKGMESYRRPNGQEENPGHMENMHIGEARTSGRRRHREDMGWGTQEGHGEDLGHWEDLGI